jgi:molecular chaperone GrpE
MENTRRRAERDVAQSRKYGHTGFARDLLSVVENLSRAVEALPEERDNLDDTMKNLVIGVEMISRELASVLERHGISRIMPMGEKFNHNQHQAMFEVPTNDAEPGTVVQVAQSGWMLHDRLLSPAMVGVAKAADGNSETDNNAAEKETGGGN